MRRSRRHASVCLLTRVSGCMDESNCFGPLDRLGFIRLGVSEKVFFSRSFLLRRLCSTIFLPLCHHFPFSSNLVSPWRIIFWALVSQEEKSEVGDVDHLGFTSWL
jgi:hypothetical protein